MVRVIIAVALAASVQFGWGFVFYGPLASLNHMTSRAPDEAGVAEALRAALPESGTYFFPMCPGMDNGFLFPNVSKFFEIVPCADWDPQTNTDPPGCNWFTLPPEPN